MSWHYLQGPAVACWRPSSSESIPDALLKLIPMPGASYSPVRETECSGVSQFGTTLKPSTVAPGGVQSSLFLAVSPAKTLARRVKVEELPPSVRDYSSKCSELLKRYGLSLSSRKTRQTLELEGLLPSSKSLTAWGMTSGGAFWELGKSAALISVTECGFSPIYPTPTAKSYGTNMGGANGRKGKRRPSLSTMARRGMWPTPTVKGNYAKAGQTQKGGDGLATAVKKQMPPNAVAGGPLNPTWVGWLMGWPLGWTDLKPLEMDKFRRWLVLHGKYSRAGF